MKHRSDCDRGNVSILMIGVVAVSLSCALSLVGLDVHLNQSAGAQTVADAVALAVVNFSADAAHEVADRNDGVIETINISEMGVVTVTVRVGDALATATASDLP
ncbi:hypothetical protein LBMAG12_17390 [Actinomycetes bacterium]|nr:hypothetical protein LBMAG12_17390 [Actinomycetes bacterium]